MTRAKNGEPRDRQFNMGLTDAEFKRIEACATAAGMRLVDYGRAKLFDEAKLTQAIRATRLDPLLFQSLSRLGNNLNQIARKVNALGLPPPPTLEPLLREIRLVLNRGIDK